MGPDGYLRRWYSLFRRMNIRNSTSKMKEKPANGGSDGIHTAIIRRSRAKRKLNMLTIFGLICIIIITISNFVTNFRGSDAPMCKSIYMYPSYAKIDGFDTRHSRLARKYHLYLYREQQKDRDPILGSDIQLDGIPVLFIPGNAGSYRQVRSIAAASANLYFGDDKHKITNDKAKNLDFFTADFNEDFTAFHGRTMLDQAEYCNDAIRYILSLYSRSSSYKTSMEPLPASVIVIGHSMGGIVARVMTTLKNHDEGSINSIITMSSPHSTSPVTFDGEILKIYERINSYWRAQFQDKDSYYSKHMSIISITGGVLDTVLPADYTSIESIVPYENGFTTYTTTIPRVWTPIDHLAIVWCDQLRKVIAALLTEMVDYSTPYKTHSLEKRIELSKRYLLSGITDASSQDLLVRLFESKTAVGVDFTHESRSIDSSGSLIINATTYHDASKYTVFRINSHKEQKTFSILTNLDNPDILACKEGSSNKNDSTDENGTTTTCKSISNYLNIIPASFADSDTLESEVAIYKYMQLNATVVAKFDTIVVAKPEKYEPNDSSFLIAELTSQQSTYTYNISLFKMPFTGLKFRHDSTVGPLVPTVRLPKQISSLIAYSLTSTYSSGQKMFQPFLSQSIIQPFETKWHLNLSEPVDITFHNEAPFVPFSSNHDSSLLLTIFAPPYTDMEFKLTINWLMTMKLLFLRYRLAIVSLPIALVALNLAYQFYHYNKGGEFISFDTSLGLLVYNHWKKILLVKCLLTPLVTIAFVQKLLFLLDPAGMDNPLLLHEKGIVSSIYYLGIREIFMLWLGPMFFPMALLVVRLVYGIIKLLEFAFSKSYGVLLLLLSRFNIFRRYIAAEEHRKFKLRQLFGICFMTAGVIFYIPYQFAFVLISLVQLVTCLKLALPTKSTKEHNNLKNYNRSILMMFIFLLPIHIPIVIVFFHNLAIRWETPFNSHHNFLAVLPLLLLVTSNSGLNMPRSYSNEKYVGKVTIFSFIYLSLYSIIFGIRNIYWLYHLFVTISGWLYFTTLNISLHDD
ncbi:HDL494Cp [Eremothecium sinecaudum]|uniref:GPI inositol-deacylase n=1 Tax=Eremothecium sinecaudum TaxID=45286 RepID=A0A120K231_9SACH|nr:HDL494Cp [Eremothecium sinecaudum]AMD20250.1 HDL494Cp [Eremothecium sinecaudum]